MKTNFDTIIYSEDFNIIKSENGIVDVEFTCRRGNPHTCSLTWCEANCKRYHSCDKIAQADDHLVDNGY